MRPLVTDDDEGEGATRCLGRSVSCVVVTNHSAWRCRRRGSSAAGAASNLTVWGNHYRGPCDRRYFPRPSNAGRSSGTTSSHDRTHGVDADSGNIRGSYADTSAKHCAAGRLPRCEPGGQRPRRAFSRSSRRAPLSPVAWIRPLPRARNRSTGRSCVLRRRCIVHMDPRASQAHPPRAHTGAMRRAVRATRCAGGVFTALEWLQPLAR